MFKVCGFVKGTGLQSSRRNRKFLNITLSTYTYILLKKETPHVKFLKVLYDFDEIEFCFVV